ncbi:MAG: beta-ketoacyl synthase chain length factor [Steroidobacteraceae bacterium]
MNIAGYVGGIGILGPGLNNWAEAAAVLSGRLAYEPAPTVLPVPAVLPSTERRRTGRVVKTALAVALEATSCAGIEPAKLASVFASSGGDGHNCHEICRALALEAREISPTRFANSVHNAAAGYWSIATGAKRASTVLCAFDASFCAGLLEALTQVTVDEESLLLIAYDTEYPDPMRSKRPIPDAFGAALVLTPRREAGSLARIEASLGFGACEALADAGLESLRATNPAARCLPLLRQLAMHVKGRTVLEYLDLSNTIVEVEPCN